MQSGHAQAAPLAAASATREQHKVASRYLVSARFDQLYFIWAPVLAFVLTVVLARFPIVLRNETLLNSGNTWAGMFIAIWTDAHLIAVAYRSHANPDVFRRFRVRFTLVPLCLFLGFLVWEPLLMTGMVLGGLWDIYHSSMQTFGFSRIYDARAGNPATRGRVLDMWLNHVVYIGPIFIGPNLAKNLGGLNSFTPLGWEAPGRLYAWFIGMQHSLAHAVMIAGGAYIVFYVLAYAALVRGGHKLSRPKIMLLVSTALISILAWGFLPPFQAFFITNFFHALQYFAIVWATEKKSIQRTFRLAGRRGGAHAALLLFAVTIFGMGFLHFAFGVTGVHAGIAFFTVVSLMHFWYDGFVWSVRRDEVKTA
jgi:hypothetical protein